MEWTKDLPKEEGWYWCSYQYTHVVEVFRKYGKLYVNTPYEDEDDNGDLQTYNDFNEISTLRCKWSQKLEEPEEEIHQDETIR